MPSQQPGHLVMHVHLFTENLVAHRYRREAELRVALEQFQGLKHAAAVYRRKAEHAVGRDAQRLPNQQTQRRLLRDL